MPTETSPVGPAVAFAPRSRYRVALALLQTGFVAVIAVLVAVEPSDWVAWLLLLSQLPTAAIRWMAVRALRRQPWAFRVDEAGVHWGPDGRFLPWSSVAEVEVRVARGARRLLPHLDRVLLVTPAQLAFARRAGTRPIGHAVLLAQVQATPDELVRAFRRFVDVPARVR